MKLSETLNAQPADFVRTFLESMTVHRNFLSEADEKSILEEIEPYLKRMRYEFDHWDDVCFCVFRGLYVRCAFRRRFTDIGKPNG